MSDFGFDYTAVREAILNRAEELRAALEARIREKLGGELLSVRSGALLSSIISSVTEDESSVAISVSSTGITYAAIQEFGGKTAAHEIVAVKGKALAFTAAGAEVFAKSVHHPGSIIPARSYLGSALNEMDDEMKLSLKQAVLEALGQV